jgi:hypothetical protein
VSDELARRPDVTFTGQGTSFRPPGREAQPTPRTVENLPHASAPYLILRDAWGEQVFIPLTAAEVTFSSSYASSQLRLVVEGLVDGDGNYTAYSFLPPRTATIEMRDDDQLGPNVPMMGMPYFP